MLPVQYCPVCHAEQFQVLGARTYAAADAGRLDDYTARRYRVLFEVWCPGQAEVRIESILCRSCGLVIYTPRPTGEDLDRKYRFLTGLGSDRNANAWNAPVEQLRSKDHLRRLAPWTKFGTARILDYGGADGRLMSAFVERGCACFVVDYNPHAAPGITKLADTLDAVPGDLKFDLIICSHVLEHLADPLGIVIRLRERLAEGGALYVEVPMEIWRRPPLLPEPVTHVNFFTAESLRCLLERAGFRVLACHMAASLHPTGQQPTAVRAVAVPAAASDKAESAAAGAARAVERLLAPDWRLQVKMFAMHPDRLWKAIRSRWSR